VTSGLEAQCQEGLYKRTSRILQFAGFSFDTYIADIFATLLSGGCICLPKEDRKLENLTHNINSFAANTIDLTPSVARTLEPEDVPGLEVLRLGGEAMTEQLVKKWADECELQNT
jgi:non-ribosomal peptide synthetase component F